MDMSAAEYIIKKSLAFVLIYCLSAVLGEGIIIGILYGMGYDPLRGIMPSGLIGDLLPYYGFIIFALAAFSYIRFVEKRTIKTVSFPINAIINYFVGALLAVTLLFIIISINCIIGSMDFCGFNPNTKIEHFILWILAFGVQGTAEEIMCRGFLLKSLEKRISTPMAIIISSTAFVIPHLSSLLEADFLYVIVGILNLYLISAIFSILVMWRSSIWISCGLHSIWNFTLYWIMGLLLSGNEGISKGIMLFNVKETNILNGAEYGIEASIITTIVLGVSLYVMIKIWKGRIGKNGI